MPIWILSSNIIRIISTFQSSALCLMPPQLHERVGKWTHQPRSNLNHKKHLFDTSICTLISALNYSKNTKHIYFLAYTYKTQKHHYRIIYIFTLLHCYLLYRTAYHIFFLFIFTPCAWQPLNGVGNTRTRNLICRLLEEERQELLQPFPESSI
jgi:hypothetical protein